MNKDVLLSMIETDEKTHCWNWTKVIDRDGYGTLRISGHIKRAARVSYEMHKGIIPSNMYVCHTCDNPKCINPDHLFLGSPQDNANDMKMKHRQAIGDKVAHYGKDNGRTKLNWNRVIEIRTLYATGIFSQRDLS